MGYIIREWQKFI